MSAVASAGVAVRVRVCAIQAQVSMRECSWVRGCR